MSTSRCDRAKEEASGMNIWDSVQRGLEKATQEATRLARTQRLRSTIDKLTQQIHTREDDLLVRTMEVFAAGQLTQSELLPICQEVAQLQKQLEQAQHELKAVNQSIPQSQPPNAGSTPTYPIRDYAPYDQTIPTPTPPPPPGVDEVSSFDTIRMSSSTPEEASCSNCHTKLIPGNAFCHNCGTPIGSTELAKQQTVRADSSEEIITPPASAESEVQISDHDIVTKKSPTNPLDPQEKDRGV